MPRFGPIKRRDLVKFFKQLGFEGPYEGDIGRELLGRILKQAGIVREEWERL